MSNTKPIFISAIICTRNRPQEVVRSAAAVLANDYPAFELLVVDQSAGNDTRMALDRFARDERLRVLPSNQTGLSRARNQAACAARGQILGYTDDDCEVRSDWLQQLACAFARDAGIHLVFGGVQAAPHAAIDGFITSYEPKSPLLVRNISDRHRSDGIGACMAVRRSSWQALHGFDEQFGAGAPLCAAEDNDFALAALAQNYWIYETPDVQVVHHGIRNASAHESLIFNYMFGSGAMFAKHIRLRSPGISLLLARVALRWAFGKALVNYSSAGNSAFRLRAFSKGFVTGWRTPLDQKTKHFKPQ